MELTIVHDNGVAGQYGSTEYTQDEVKKLGGIDAIVSAYAENNIQIFRIVRA